MSTTQKFTLSSLVLAVIALVLFFGSFSATALAAGNSIPGDSLYPFKTRIEQTRISMTGNPDAQARLHLAYAQRRLDEVGDLIDAGRFDQVAGTAAEFQTHMQNALEVVRQLAIVNPIQAQEVNLEITHALARYAIALNRMLAEAPTSLPPAVKNAMQTSISAALPEVGELEFSGVVDQISVQSWVVGPTTLVITSQTEIKGLITVGDMVKVHASPGADITLLAREIEIVSAAEAGNDDSVDNGNQNGNANEAFDDNGIDQSNTNTGDNSNDNADDDPSDHQGGETRFTGVVSQINPTTWLVSGLSISIIPATEIGNGIVPGSLIEVHAIPADDGTLVATELQLAESLSGESGGSNNQNTSNNNNTNNVNSADSGNSNDDGPVNDNSNPNASSSGDSNANSNQDDGNVNGDDHGNGNDNDSRGKGGRDDNGNDNVGNANGD